MKHWISRRVRPVGMAIAALAVAGTATVGMNIAPAGASRPMARGVRFVTIGPYQGKSLPGFVSSTGKFCVSTEFQTSGSDNAAYGYEIYDRWGNQARWSGWIRTGSSVTKCFDRNIFKGEAYRLYVFNGSGNLIIQGRVGYYNVADNADGDQ